MGIGSKPFMDIKPSDAAISDRAIDYIMKGSGELFFYNNFSLSIISHPLASLSSLLHLPDSHNNHADKQHFFSETTKTWLFLTDVLMQVGFRDFCQVNTLSQTGLKPLQPQSTTLHDSFLWLTRVVINNNISYYC